MIKRPVLVISFALIIFGSSTQPVDARSNLLDLIFKSRLAVKNLTSQKTDFNKYLEVIDMLRESKVLAATEEHEDNEQLTDPVSALISISPTSSPQPSVTPTAGQVSEDLTPDSVMPTVLPTKMPETNSIVSETDYILAKINQFRQQHGLAAATKESYTCSFANLRAKELASSFDHNAFQQRRDGNTLPYPSWSFVTENIAMNSNYRGVIDQWTNSSGHTQNMLADTPHICVGKFGNYYAMLGWKP